MTIKVKEDFGEGLAGLAPGDVQGDPNLAQILRALIDAAANNQAAIKAVTAKLDADAANTALDDTDYAATCDPADLTIEKG